MKARSIGLVTKLALVGLFVLAAKPPQAAESSAGSVNMENVAKIKVGSSTEQQVKELLGVPYRMTNYGDCNPVDYQEIWEYLGQEADGVFKVHIEFDEAHIARIVAKDTKIRTNRGSGGRV